ncbi:hypothetical protein [Burkholderia oklahomensis]|uniref:hypothetical protein n=1 Tax=Burkholderia oklahomensis TaxID=342113 RepID=UPI0018DB2CC6|nr:hypothetical protein [Burkholderia oklahomensis]
MRRIYSDAEAAYLAEERKRLGLLAHKLEDARKRREDKAKEFTREYKGVQMADLAPFLDVNHEDALANVETALEAAKPEQVNAASNPQVVNGESRKWLDSNKTNLGPAVPAHEALDLDALAALMAEAENRANAALERMRAANEAANQAADRANRKRTAAEADGKDAVGAADGIKQAHPHAARTYRQKYRQMTVARPPRRAQAKVDNLPSDQGLTDLRSTI